MALPQSKLPVISHAVGDHDCQSAISRLLETSGRTEVSVEACDVVHNHHIAAELGQILTHAKLSLLPIVCAVS